ncbi:hypothetical protein [Sphingobacterium griseoflavum]|uniref:DUF4270 domain-containing protein n=1 Tax=Sphingobacterium griseoflavum TaxID=1474952 RepID=A0ABQ3HWE0_9SPHI|nr:hypothetical protein [Sphingobacterium griseoflavum]GHE41196.1 hypothetical protein GCM10017764_25610 [Sphingobacterium griseoflavum]
MKNFTYMFWYGFSLLFIIYACSCQRETYPDDDMRESYTVAVKFKEFDQTIRELKNNQRTQLAQAKKRGMMNGLRAAEGDFVYFWSFNQGTLEPDIFATEGATLTYNQGLTPFSFAGGWSFESYTAGFGLTITGANEILLKIPLEGITAVQDFGLDMGSSGTGPKSFSLSYGQNGQDYTLLSEDNQFSNTNTAHAKNTFVFSLQDVELDKRRDLYIKIIPKAGFRGEASDYRASTGVIKLDNIRLTGEKGVSEASSVKALHYHVFDAENKDLITFGTYDYAVENLTDFSLSLPLGRYIVSFVANESDSTLVLPSAPSFSNWYVGNRFANYTARVFGLLDTFTVSGHMERELILKRYFSQIKFEFTDPGDLTSVGKIVIRRMHEPEFYAPFNRTLANPILDQSQIVIFPTFMSGDKTIFFNQFIGNVMEPFDIAYRIDVYSRVDTLLRTFELTSAIRNNMQLVFRGPLLGDTGTGSSFSILFKEDWDGHDIISF